MEFPTLCTLLPEAGADRTLETAIACARRFKSHLDVVCTASPAINTADFGAGFGVGGAIIADTIEETSARLRDTDAMARKRLSREDISWSSQALMAGGGGLAQTVKDACRFADLAVLARPNGENFEVESLFDAILFGTALPILLVDGPEVPEFNRITIAWDSSDQSLAAARAALPLLRQAKVVTVLMVDPPESPAGRFAPGECLATFLSRHDIECDIDLLPRMKARIADVIKQHTSDTQSDLLVMGAYGHSKLREQLLGGVTRELVQNSGMPMFLAR
ncbi:universal stress protein [Puniceibacterium sediminis]|uniref:Universal stress protein family protein n=1 Tax=Puniceibacterium sediminis TaxID=1608407 RepID=A0A238VDM0_9RHOB|nr:universal stress protein [Puniceibacterium sediminis]SNR32495.1 Universal stress protein family protein [Puniceibacterium sediminis]